MKYLHRIWGATLLFSTYSAIFAAGTVPVPVLTLEQALDGAEKNSTALLEHRLSLEAAQRQLQNNWNTWMPSFSLSGNVANTHDLTGSESSVWNWSASGGISLTLRASMPSQMKQAAEAYESAEIAYRQSRSSLRNSITGSFYDLLAAKENIALQKENLEQAEVQLALVQIKYNSGLSSELDLLNARYAVASLKPEIQRLESEFRYNVQSFCVAVGMDSPVLPELSGSIVVTKLDLPDSAELAARYGATRFDVKAAENALSAAETAASIAVTGTRAPSITLSEQLTCRELNGTVTPGGTFTAAVSIPLNGFIPGTTESLSIRTRKDAVETARQSLVQTRKEAEIDIAKKSAAVTQTYDSIDAAALNVQIAVRSWELARDGYNNGLIDQKDLEDYRIKKSEAQQTLIQKQISYVSAVTDLAAALAISPEELSAAFSLEEQK